MLTTEVWEVTIELVLSEKSSVLPSGSNGVND